MPEITTYTEALRAIWDRSGYDKGFISNPFAGDDAARLGLVRTQTLLTHLGHHPLPYAIVHVAGSKGKGSTCTMIAAILRAAEVRTGIYMSPQLHSFRERFDINGELISEGDFVALTKLFIGAAEEIEAENPSLGEITAFEISTAMALGWFAQQRVDVAVIEVGLGGTLDATNIVDPAISVITTLDYEHTAILGETLAEIASNKAGIIKQDRPVVTASQPSEAMTVIRARADEMNASLQIAGVSWQVTGDDRCFCFRDDSDELHDLSLAMVGNHQIDNAGLAIAAVQQLPGLEITESAIRAGLAVASLPARFEETADTQGRHIIIDGAHTPKSAAALAQAIASRYPGKQPTLVIGMLADKNPQAVLAPLLEISERVIVVQPPSPRAMPVTELAAAVEAMGREVEICARVEDGLAAADGELIVVTGSFTTAAEARIVLGLATIVDPPVS
ncbi:MAG: bifunctional folylpolyglutamate synthase/dihydrofolate synthase [Thermomicrobiales bacterium]|nr:bifunctional folylpolyglutamate synthase/dihydrofolate synthase [Thermomicrobiales bacterium]